MANRSEVRDWLKSLGVLVAGSISREEAEARLHAYVPLLSATFDDAAFCPESLEAVGRRCKFFPSYAEVVEHLSAWWSQHRPMAPRLVGPRMDELDRQATRETWQDANAVRNSIRLCAGNRALLLLLGRCLQHYAPQHLALLELQYWPTQELAAGPELTDA